MKYYQDMRLNEEIFKNMIGHRFVKYKCDAFVYTNSVTGIVGIYLDDGIYKIKNEQESIQYFDSIDDVAVWNINKVENSDIQSYFDNTQQIDNPVDEIIKKITLVNEHQTIEINHIKYELLVTRSIIFHLETKDIYFEKDHVSFSEEIEIKRGHDLINEYPKNNDYFLEEWTEGIVPTIKTDFVSIQ